MQPAVIVFQLSHAAKPQLLQALCPCLSAGLPNVQLLYLFYTIFFVMKETNLT